MLESLLSHSHRYHLSRYAVVTPYSRDQEGSNRSKPQIGTESEFRIGRTGLCVPVTFGGAAGIACRVCRRSFGRSLS
jgi:hypothetical protein